MSVFLPTPLAAVRERRFVGIEVMVVRSWWPEGRRDVTRCQEYKAGDKGDGGHICDS